MTGNPRRKHRFWESLLRATETEPRDVDRIRGASGLSHPVLAVGVDERRRRIVMISGEADGRSAVLAQSDIQALMPDVKVVMARPVPVNLAAAAKAIGNVLGSLRITTPMLKVLEDEGARKNAVTAALEEATQFTFKPFEYAILSAVAGWKEAIQQLALVELDQPGDADQQDGPILGLDKLAALDPAEYDRRMGVCTIPLYDFAEEEAEHFQRGADPEVIREILRKHDILQYFFPPADQLILGIVDRSPQPIASVVRTINRVPSLGHPLGELELVAHQQSLDATVAALTAKGLLVEGEAGVEVTAAGTSVRSVVRFKPREGLLSKIANIFSVKLDITLRDLFRF